jgi:RNA-splicing ligase RtcB
MSATDGPGRFQTFEHAADEVFGASAGGLGMSMVYDVSHDLAKFEDYTIEGWVLTLEASGGGVTEIACRGSSICVQRRLPGGKSL